MPDLPTVTLTTAQAQRCLAAWGTAADYRKWLAEQVREYVRTYERESLIKSKRSETDAGLAAIDEIDPLAGV